MSCETQNIVINDIEFQRSLLTEIDTLGRMAYWHTGDSEDAEELLQDTCVLALRFADTYRDGSNIRAWLLRIMRNRHVSVMRRRSLEKRVAESEGRHALTEWAISETSRRSTRVRDSARHDEGFSDLVLEAMRELHPDFREAVWMCDVLGMSYADAAKKAGRPIGTIMSRIHRGRKALRKKLISREHLEAA